jgi:thioredoxin 1
MSNVKSVTDQDFKSEVLDSTTPVLVDFWATWCGPCRMMSPVIDSISKKYESKLKVVKLNTDENCQTAQDYGIQGIPSLLIFEAGKEIGRLMGFMPEKTLDEKLKCFIK